MLLREVCVCEIRIDCVFLNVLQCGLGVDDGRYYAELDKYVGKYQPTYLGTTKRPVKG